MKSVSTLRIQRLLKRLLDVSVATTFLILLSPVYAFVAMIVRWKLGSPVFFKQERPGRSGVSFFVFKFRTMTDERDELGVLLPDEMRLTRLGRFIRSSSLDELPQLWNVLIGEMSLVGPRPLLVQYLALYSLEERRRHHVVPGITGWAQVNGRNALTWKEKFRFDVWYVDNWSFWLDIRILWLTAVTVLSRRGVSKKGHATTVAYDGSN